MSAQAQIIAFPATRHPKFEIFAARVKLLAWQHVSALHDCLMPIAAHEYGALLKKGVREDVAMERADDLLCSLLTVADTERRKLLAELAFASPNP